MPFNVISENDKEKFRADIIKLTTQTCPYLLIGDLNAKHTLWNNSNINNNGKILASLSDLGYFTVFPPDRPTRTSFSGTSSTIDIILTNIPDKIIYSSTIYDLPSDHYPTITSVLSKSTTKSGPHKIDYNNADWNIFKETIIDNLIINPVLESTEDIDRNLENFALLIQTAEAISTPKIAVRQKYDVKLDEETLNLINIRKDLERRAKRNPALRTLKNQYAKLVKSRINLLRNQRFSNTIEKLPTRSTPFWKLTKILKNKSVQIPPIRTGNTILLTDSEKAEAFASNFQKFHETSINKKSNMDKIVKETNKSISMTPSFAPTENMIHQNEIINIVKKFKNFKAPGLDNIMSITLKKLPKEAFEFLAHIFNKCFTLSYFPTYWKTAKVIPIGKAGKDLSQVTGYRPISLLSCISKIYEKIILSKLEDHIFSENILLEEQYGFRSGHSTVHQLQRVVKHIKTAKNSSKTTLMALLDIEKAFDSVWHEGLIYKLYIFNFPIYLIKMIKSYLENRKYKVFIGGKYSETYSIPAGVPQGSVLGPVLYNIFTSDFPTAPPSCERAFYADDTALMATDFGTKRTKPKLQKYLNDTTKYYKKWKIVPNSSKTEVIRFDGSKRKRNINRFKKIKVNNTEIEWSKSVKYLGLTIDENLKFRNHCDLTLEKGRKVLRLLYPLLNRRSKLNRNNKLAIYCQIIRPIITYASTVWRNVNIGRKKKLQVFQNKILKMALGLHYRTRTTLVHEMAQIPLISDFMDKLENNLKTSSENSVHEHIRNIFL
jgi:hypothetical protein